MRAQLTDEDDAAITIDPGATVTAVIVDSDNEAIVAEITLSPSDTGADWPNGWVAAEWTSAQTANVGKVDLAWLHVRIDGVTHRATLPIPVRAGVFG